MDRAAEISRKELYGQVWAEPTIQLAKKYGISDVGLAKICRRNNIPVPPRGYWARKQAGQKVSKIPLPHAESDNTIRISPTVADEPPPVLEELNPANEKFAKPIIIPAQLRNPHPLVQESQTALGSLKDGYDGILTGTTKRHLDIRVSAKSLKRSLRIMDTVIKALEGVGCKVSITGSGTTAQISDIAVYFGVQERRKQTFEKSDSSSYLHRVLSPTGNLQLTIKGPYAENCRKNWEDTPKRKIEDGLNQFLIGLLNYAAHAKAHDLRLEEDRRRREEQRRIRAEKLACLEAEKMRVSGLLTSAENWKKSVLIRDFADAVEGMWRSGDFHFETNGEHQEWLAWARQQADRLDPLKESPKSILDEEEQLKRSASMWGW